MKLKSLTPDPATFLRAGLSTLSDAAILVHVGRCGLCGCALSDLSDTLRIPYNTVSQCCDRLRDAGFLTRFSRTNRRGRAYWYVVTVPGWELLTTPPEVHLFPDATKGVGT